MVKIVSAATITIRLDSFGCGAAQHLVKRHYDYAFRVDPINQLTQRISLSVTGMHPPNITLLETQGPTKFYQRASLVNYCSETVSSQST